LQMDNGFETGESSREIIKDKLRQHFDGKIVRKDLTKKIKEGANVTVYVIEFPAGTVVCEGPISYQGSFHLGGLEKIHI